MISTITGFWNNFLNLNRVGRKWFAAASQIRDLSNFTDFSRQNGKTYRQTVFSIVIYVFELVFARKILNYISFRFSRKSILAISPMSKSRILTIFQTSPIFPVQTVKDILKRIFPSYSTYLILYTLSVW